MPASTVKDLYVGAFVKIPYGAPLFHPTPITLGDIGYIDENDGHFKKLFNISKPGRGFPALKVKEDVTKEVWGPIHVILLPFSVKFCLTYLKMRKKRVLGYSVCLSV
ncbi:hypothetical protein M422DRAFT_32320 [Sphaerobolus stellatus SS14]|uniref:Uncharacterized protein n=1 Tax=Sphaerobolus stellatus (strain SS14) TaxID=990650 RepID=A0A0C9VFP8_SPHS4|nr:hypothetical protein M422DRAFT_32320 [Sphaerobolus stellatus SS14]